MKHVQGMWSSGDMGTSCRHATLCCHFDSLAKLARYNAYYKNRYAVGAVTIEHNFSMM